MSPTTEKSIVLDGEVFVERRAEARRRVLKGATMTFNNGYSAFECIVRNQSQSGACLSLGETFALPKSFQLVIAGEQPRMVEIRWSSMTSVGVALV